MIINHDYMRVMRTGKRFYPSVRRGQQDSAVILAICILVAIIFALSILLIPSVSRFMQQSLTKDDIHQDQPHAGPLP